MPATRILRNLLTPKGLHAAHAAHAAHPAHVAQSAHLPGGEAQPAGSPGPQQSRSERLWRAWFGPPGAKRRFAPLALVLLIAGLVIAGSAEAQPPPNRSHGKVAGPVAPDWPQTNGVVQSLAPPTKQVFHLKKATTKPAPAPPAIAAGPSLQSHEVFAFAPYWTLASQSGFNVADMTTLSYFGVDVNPNGSIERSGDGWTGYQSQDLANLITRAHAAGDRVVLTAECFDQASLDSLASNPPRGRPSATNWSHWSRRRTSTV